MDPEFFSSICRPIRVELEQRWLPRCFFEDASQLLRLLIGQKDFLFRLVDDMFRDARAVNPYRASDFRVEYGRLTDYASVARITFPSPEDASLCYRAFLFFDADFRRLGYFSVERGGALGARASICSYDALGTRRELGVCSLADDADLLRCFDIYMGSGSYAPREREERVDVEEEVSARDDSRVERVADETTVARALEELERRVLPAMLYKDPAATLANLLANKSALLFQLYETALERLAPAVAPPFCAQEFGVATMRVSADISVARVDWPYPFAESLGYCAYIFYENELRKIGYFLLERRADLPENEARIIAIESDGRARDYGVCDLTRAGGVKRCASIFINAWE